MSEEERGLYAYDILLKIHVIVGWTIPVSEFMDILTSQFEQKLIESYSNVNPKEFEYAFRNRGLDIKDWGKALNLTLIDEVMLPYLETRYDLSRTEESHSHKVILIEEPKELTESEWDEWLVDMQKYDFKLLPCAAYEYLVKTGKLSLTVEEKHAYMEKAISYLTGTFEPATKEMSEYLEMKKNGVFSVQITSSLATFAKRYAIFDYLNFNL